MHCIRGCFISIGFVFCLWHKVSLSLAPKISVWGMAPHSQPPCVTMEGSLNSLGIRGALCYCNPVLLGRVFYSNYLSAIPIFTTVAVLVECFDHWLCCRSQNFRGSLGVVSAEWGVGEILEVIFLKPQERKIILADLFNHFLDILKTIPCSLDSQQQQKKKIKIVIKNCISPSFLT